MRKLARSFFWIDQDLVRSGLWLKLSNVERLAYVALAASVNRDGVSLWGSEKLISLAGLSRQEWEISLTKLVEWNLARLPAAGDIGICLVSLDPCNDKSLQASESLTQRVQGVIPRGPFILKTTTTVELGEHSVESKSSK